MIQTSYSIAVLPGDGIGREVMTAAVEVLSALEAKLGRRFIAAQHPAGAQHYVDSGNALPDSTLDACRAADARMGCNAVSAACASIFSRK